MIITFNKEEGSVVRSIPPACLCARYGNLITFWADFDEILSVDKPWNKDDMAYNGGKSWTVHYGDPTEFHYSARYDNLYIDKHRKMALWGI